jgi:hypothetical protein
MQGRQVMNIHQPTEPMDRYDTVLTLVIDEKYELTLLEAEALVDRAVASVSGMAFHPRPRTFDFVWVTHMTTQGGKFIIEIDW